MFIVQVLTPFKNIYCEYSEVVKQMHIKESNSQQKVAFQFEIFSM